MRKKQHGASTAQIEVTGPQPGVPYSTEVHDNHHGHSSSRQHLVSPRRNVAAHHVAATNNALGPADPAHDGTPPPWDPHCNSPNADTGLQLNIDTETLRQDNGVGCSRTRRSPPPLSHSPSSITSARRRPHPPGSAHSVQPAKVLRFGEREEEVKVEYAVQRSPPQRYSVSAKGVLPDISNGRITPRPSLAFPAFGAFGSANSISGDNEKESLFDEDPLEQHFHAMPLSPGVKVRAGDESNEGPELPLFASRMRRSTFARMDTCTLPAPNPDPLSPRTSIPTNQHLVQPQTGTFITEAAWGLASKSSIDVAHGRLVPDCWGGEKSEDLSSAEPTASCSCSSSTSLVRNGGDSNLGTRMALLTRRRTADTLPQAEQGSASMSVMQSRAHSNRSDEFHKRDQTARVPLEAPMLANVIVSIQASTRRFSAANNERSCFFTSR
ncbi:hypothetical protein PHYSODRAFT_306615 [Phytophthora sojae]|uniref:Uncharacterized protein n=1 Tax=Phytophthora sojae (strain P6497) TaxID=1094619 RepID=G5AA11_PHYSP|nr:hypothetical protein PHYSODRAFT_306615 [Phytophthora sojae]EGZ07440.1 hypothetical protein PHYSODRAFT_306615 [Phytophthora sojae]|eukprot:XP_009537006.1 hypothetical protein PHYSODRAFT_306615 [Phytophthora sojae]